MSEVQGSNTIVEFLLVQPSVRHQVYESPGHTEFACVR